MRSPERTLTARRQNLRLNWMGVRVNDESGSEGNDITLAQLLSLEDDQRSAVLVTYNLLKVMPDSQP